MSDAMASRRSSVSTARVRNPKARQKARTDSPMTPNPTMATFSPGPGAALAQRELSDVEDVEERGALVGQAVGKPECEVGRDRRVLPVRLSDEYAVSDREAIGARSYGFDAPDHGVADLVGEVGAARRAGRATFRPGPPGVPRHVRISVPVLSAVRMARTSRPSGRALGHGNVLELSARRGPVMTSRFIGGQSAAKGRHGRRRGARDSKPWGPWSEIVPGRAACAKLPTRRNTPLHHPNRRSRTLTTS